METMFTMKMDKPWTVKNGQTMNSEGCSELDTTSTAMMLFNNGYVVMMDTSSTMDNTLQVIIQPSTAKHAIQYFSSTFDVSTVC